MFIDISLYYALVNINWKVNNLLFPQEELQNERLYFPRQNMWKVDGVRGFMMTAPLKIKRNRFFI